MDSAKTKNGAGNLSSTIQGLLPKKPIQSDKGEEPGCRLGNTAHITRVLQEAAVCFHAMLTDIQAFHLFFGGDANAQSRLQHDPNNRRKDYSKETNAEDAQDLGTQLRKATAKEQAR